jgi:enoyl-CoA hydratase
MADTQKNSDVLLVERPHPEIAVLLVNRPAYRNSLNVELKRRLETALHQLASDQEVRVVVVTGSEGWFVAGTDIAEMKDMAPADHAERGTNDVWQAMRAFPKPMIAAVEKVAFGGGCELALSCDIVIAAETARFGLPEIKVGIMPGAGGSQYLLRTIGRYRAARMVLTGEPVSGREAAAMGMVSEAVEDGTTLDRAMALAETISQMPLTSVLAIKAMLKHGHDAHLGEALVRERELFVGLFGSDDQREGMAAFLEKRPAQFNKV